MKTRYIIPVAALSLVALTTSCKKEGCTDEKATNYSDEAKKDDGSCEYSFDQYDAVPSTYAFTRDGESTVSFSGQTERKNMLDETVNYIKTAHTPGVSLSEDKILQMFKNEGGHFSFTSTKQLYNKIAGEDATILGELNNWIATVVDNSDSTVTGEYKAENGKAGVIGDASKAYLVDKNGVEFAQMIAKGTMGSCFLYQITHGYLGDEKMNVDNEVFEDGENYTTMEHHWDEAYGYFAEADFPNGDLTFWASYCDKVDAALGTNASLGDAFRRGRWAIMNKDMALRDEQITIINTELEKVCAGSAIHYINSALSDLGNDVTRSHYLSECKGFIYALQFIKGGSFTRADVLALMGNLDNLYEVSSGTLNTLKSDIATKAGISDVADQL